MIQKQDLSLMEQRVLRCITFKTKTAQAIYDVYIRIYPRRIINGQMTPQTSIDTVIDTLYILVEKGLVRMSEMEGVDNNQVTTPTYEVIDKKGSFLGWRNQKT